MYAHRTGRREQRTSKRRARSQQQIRERGALLRKRSSYWQSPENHLSCAYLPSSRRQDSGAFPWRVASHLLNRSLSCSVWLRCFRYWLPKPVKWGFAAKTRSSFVIGKMLKRWRARTSSRRELLVHDDDWGENAVLPAARAVALPSPEPLIRVDRAQATTITL